MNDLKRFRIILCKLKKRLPLENSYLKFAFKEIKAEGLCYGPYKDKNGCRYVYMVVEKRMSFSAKIDAMLHEYAHAMMKAKNCPYSADDQVLHGMTWGKCYSIVYREFLKIMEDLNGGTI